MSRPPIIETRDLSLEFTVHDGVGVARTLKVLSGVNLSIRRGSILGLIGESGSGKTSLARVLAMMHGPSAGEVWLDGERSVFGNRTSMKRHGSMVQLMFQDPFASLNPLHRVRYTLGRALRLYGFAGGSAELEAGISALLTKVRLHPPPHYLDKFPHQLSGGQRQRVVLARALAARPKVLLADEPISMLDVSIRAEILNLLGDLREQDDLAIVYVTHDVASARYLCNEIAVLYAGQIVEHGECERVIQNPQHPYTQMLLEASPDPAVAMQLPRDQRFTRQARGEPPNLAQLPAGCRFAARCPVVMAQCRDNPPPDRHVDHAHRARCWNVSENSTAITQTPMRPDTSSGVDRVGAQ